MLRLLRVALRHRRFLREKVLALVCLGQPHEPLCNFSDLSLVLPNVHTTFCNFCKCETRASLQIDVVGVHECT